VAPIVKIDDAERYRRRVDCCPDSDGDLELVTDGGGLVVSFTVELDGQHVRVCQELPVADFLATALAVAASRLVPEPED